MEGQQSSIGGSWSAEPLPNKKVSFTEMFDAAIKDAVRGLWTAGETSGGWTIRTYK